MTLSIVDQSLLALKENKNDIIEYFYSNNNSSVSTI
jgi:hypothetical protein